MQIDKLNNFFKYLKTIEANQTVGFSSFEEFEKLENRRAKFEEVRIYFMALIQENRNLQNDVLSLRNANSKLILQHRQQKTELEEAYKRIKELMKL